MSQKSKKSSKTESIFHNTRTHVGIGDLVKLLLGGYITINSEIVVLALDQEVPNLIVKATAVRTKVHWPKWLQKKVKQSYMQYSDKNGEDHKIDEACPVESAERAFYQTDRMKDAIKYPNDPLA